MKNTIKTIDQAGELYETGKCNCCEAIMTSISEHMDIQEDLLLKIAAPFGGGMVGNGAACGSLIAAYLCMGAFKSNNLDNENRDIIREASNRIFQKFCAKYGSPNCNEIRGYDKNDPHATSFNHLMVKQEICIPLTKEVTQWILEELKEPEL